MTLGDRHDPDWAALIALARIVVARAAAAGADAFLDDWPTGATTRPVTPAALGVLRYLDAAAGAAPRGRLADLATALARSACALAWRQSYAPHEVASPFLERYGWSELMGRSGPVACDPLACGVLLLGPDTHYPAHSHPAEELYVPLSGAAGWQRGHAAFVTREPGEVIVHASGERHAMRTGAAPLLALYVWRGAGLGRAARLDPARPVRA